MIQQASGMPPDLRDALVVRSIDRSFRDIADQDYIAARAMYRYDLKWQFLWSSQQAIEKYLKAILLYGGEDTRDLGHDLVEGLRRVRATPDLPFALPPQIDEFISYLGEEGTNRYFSYPGYAQGTELFLLDRAVWHVRRFCYGIREPFDMTAGTRPTIPKGELDRLRAQSELEPRTGRVAGGSLERVLKEKKPRNLYDHLIWKNYFFSTVRRNVFRKVQFKGWSENPDHYLYPDIYAVLKNLVRYPKGVQDYFKKNHGL